PQSRCCATKNLTAFLLTECDGRQPMLRFLWTQKEDIGPLGLEVMTPEIWRAEDIDPAFEALKGHAEALYVILEPLVSTYRVRINTLALGPEAGGLISYGPNFPDQFRRAAEFVGKILRGTKPADIPVEQPTKFDLV